MMSFLGEQNDENVFYLSSRLGVSKSELFFIFHFSFFIFHFSFFIFLLMMYLYIVLNRLNSVKTSSCRASTINPSLA